LDELNTQIFIKLSLEYSLAFGIEKMTKKREKYRKKIKRYAYAVRSRLSINLVLVGMCDFL